MVFSACRGPSCWIGKIIILAQLNIRTRDVQSRVADFPNLKMCLIFRDYPGDCTLVVHLSPVRLPMVFLSASVPFGYIIDGNEIAQPLRMSERSW